MRSQVSWMWIWDPLLALDTVSTLQARCVASLRSHCQLCTHLSVCSSRKDHGGQPAGPAAAAAAGWLPGCRHGGWVDGWPGCLMARSLSGVHSAAAGLLGGHAQRSSLPSAIPTPAGCECEAFSFICDRAVDPQNHMGPHPQRAREIPVSEDVCVCVCGGGCQSS